MELSALLTGLRSSQGHCQRLSDLQVCRRHLRCGRIQRKDVSDGGVVRFWWRVRRDVVGIPRRRPISRIVSRVTTSSHIYH